MSRKNPEINPGQGTLAYVTQMPDHDERLAFIEKVPEIGDDSHYTPEVRLSPVVYGKRGSYVDLSERAAHLTNSLDAISTANKLGGFDIASNASQYAGPVYARYKWGTERVKRNSQEKAKRSSDEAKIEFWKATGYSALRGTGLMRDAEIDARGRKDWKDFTRAYGHPNETADRTKFKKQLQKTSDRLEDNSKNKVA